MDSSFLLKELGSSPIINAQGSLTVLGGSVLDKDVLDAYEEASRVYLDIPELHVKAGRYIADLVGAEDAYVTSGGGAALILSVAACMTRGDREKMSSIPRTEGLANGVVIQKLHRNMYDYIATLPGSRLVEIGDNQETKIQDLESNLDSKKICAVLYFAFDPQEGVLPLQKVIQSSHKSGIPVIVDAAAELPPKENLKNYLKMGADLIIFSGGKDIGAPNDTGLLLGRKDLVGFCRRLGPHSYETDSSGTRVYLGRPMKTCKEDILALCAALTKYLQMDHEKRMATWREKVEYIVREIAAKTRFKVREMTPGTGHPRPVTVPRAEITMEGEAEEIVAKLKTKTPPIYAYSVGKCLYINPQCLRDGEESIVVERLIELLS